MKTNQRETEQRRSVNFQSEMGEYVAADQPDWNGETPREGRPGRHTNMEALGQGREELDRRAFCRQNIKYQTPLRQSTRHIWTTASDVN